MIAAVLVSMVALTLTTAAVSYSIHTLNTSQVNRKFVQTTDAAAAGMDLAVAQLTSSTPPCTLSGTLPSSPTTESYTVTITYYDSNRNSLNSNCSGGVLPATTTASYADVVSVGGTNANGVYGARTMDAEVTMSAQQAGGMNDALMGYTSLSNSANFTITGDGSGNDANIYTNGNYSCTATGSDAGTVDAQGTITTGSGCTYAGDLYSKGAIDLSYTSGGAASSANAYSSQSTIKVGSNATISNNAKANGTITNSGTIGHQYPNSTLSDPPTQSFPQMNFVSSSWSGTGYTVKTESTCTPVAGDIAAETGPTVIDVTSTSCAVSMSGTVNIAYDTAIFAPGGFSFGSKATFQSSSSTSHRFYVIVPYNAATMPCTSPTISMTANMTFGSSGNPLDAYLYSPCTIVYDSSSQFIGQIYTGNSVNFSSHLLLQYAGAAWPGVVIGGSTQSGYTINLVYEREQQ